jgi:hypothetical protein
LNVTWDSVYASGNFYVTSLAPVPSMTVVTLVVWC